MRKNFLTGLALLLPFALTLWILAVFINILTYPFLGILDHFIGLDLEKLPETAQGLIFFLSKVSLLFFLTIVIFLVGYLGQLFIVRSFLRHTESILHRIPLINSIYKATKEVVNTLFHEEHTDFSKVVVVPFPNEKTRCLGFITKRDQSAYMDAQHGNMVSVFVPGIPNPTLGFVLLFDRNKLVFTDMSIEEAIKFIMSCGGGAAN